MIADGGSLRIHGNFMFLHWISVPKAGIGELGRAAAAEWKCREFQILSHFQVARTTMAPTVEETIEAGEGNHSPGSAAGRYPKWRAR